MKMMIATTPFTYGTRRLLPGDDFTAKSERDRIILKFAKKAKDADVRQTGKIAAPPKALVEKATAVKAPEPKKEEPAPPEPPKAPEPTKWDPAPALAPAQTAHDTVQALREQYKTVIGRPPFNGWDEETLRQKIAEALAEKKED